MPSHPHPPAPDAPAPVPATADAASPIPLHYTRRPATRWPLLASILAARPAQAPDPAQQPHFQAQWQGVRAAPERVQRYRQVCGLPASAHLPVLYPHALAMPLHMAILTHARFPLRLMGLVHQSNHITALHPIRTADVLDIHCTMDGITPSERGQTFGLHTTVYRQGQPVWQEHSRFIAPLPRPQRAAARPPTGADTDLPWQGPVAQWQVPAHAGRQFAGPSGDWNPIHISAWTARLFGFPRAIAHGMFNAACCLAHLPTPLPENEPLQLDLRFQRPLLLPAPVALFTATQGNTQHFVLRNAHNGEPHVQGHYASIHTPSPGA